MEKRSFKRFLRTANRTSDEAFTLIKTPLNNRGIHAVRVLIKRQRGWWRVVRHLDRRRWARVDRTLSEAAALLSGQRDLHVMEKTFNRLLDKGDRPFSELLSAHEAAPERSRVSLPMALLRLAFEFEKRARKQMLTGCRSGCLPELDQTFLSLINSASKAFASGNDEDFHRLRKRVKHYLYQAEAGLPKGAVRHLRLKNVRQLAEWLGEKHDLDVLKNVMSRQSGGSAQIKNMLMRLERKNQQILNRIEQAIFILKKAA